MDTVMAIVEAQRMWAQQTANGTPSSVLSSWPHTPNHKELTGNVVKAPPQDNIAAHDLIRRVTRGQRAGLIGFAPGVPLAGGHYRVTTWLWGNAENAGAGNMFAVGVEHQRKKLAVQQVTTSEVQGYRGQPFQIVLDVELPRAAPVDFIVYWHGLGDGAFLRTEAVLVR